MCWSYQVAGAFALAECIVLAYLWRRNALFDRHNAVLHLPVVLQEAIQAALWPYVRPLAPSDPQGHDVIPDAAVPWGAPARHQCGLGNRVGSFAIIVVVAGLGAWFFACVLQECAVHNATLRLLDEDADDNNADDDGNINMINVGGDDRAAGKNKKDLHWRRLMGRIPSLDEGPTALPLHVMGQTASGIHAALCLYCAYVFFWAYDPDANPETFAQNWIAVCTTRGEHGHQIWPMLTAANWWVKALRAGAYLTFCGGYEALPRPSILPFMFGVLAPCTLLFYLFLGDEWGSVWCWTGSMMVCAYVVEPRLCRQHHVFDRAYLDRSDRAARLRAQAGWVFRFAWGRLESWPLGSRAGRGGLDLRPWHDQMKTPAAGTADV